MSLRALRAVLAAGLLGSVLFVTTTEAAPPVAGDVHVRGGGILRGKYPPGTKAWRGPTQRAETPYGSDRIEPANARGAGNAAPPGESSPTFPVDPADEPGTIYSVAGGDCEGFPALDATIRPYRMAYDKQGRLWFLDLNKQRGSALIRYVDLDGRVRTLAPLYAPEEGRLYRGYTIPERNVLVPDDRGGVYVNRNAGDPPHFRTEPSMNDVPLSNDIEHVAADGTRTLVVGGLQLPPNTPDFTRTAGDGDPVTRTALGELQAFTVDSWGGVYLVDVPSLGATSRLRYANTTRESKTFFPGSDDQVVVEPGTIRTIAGGIGLALPGIGDSAQGVLEQRVSETVLNVVPKLVVRGSVLYYATTRWDGTATFRSQPAIVSAINLFSRTPVVVNGRTVRPGYSHVIAGDRTRQSGYSGDGGPAIVAQLAFDHDNYSGDIAVTPGGDVYISDTRNHRIRRVDSLGIITTVAGNGVKGPAPRSRTLALASPLWFPMGIDAHPDGGVAFADYSNARVRRLTPDGFLVHEAGRGPYPCGADGDYATGRGVYDGHAFRSITDVATDSKGRTYVADAGYKVIRRIEKDGRIGLTIGRPQPCMQSVLSNYEFPADVAFMSESCPNGSPPASDMALGEASFALPNYVLVDAYDNLFVSDLDAIRYVNLGKAAVPVLGKMVPPLTVATLRTFGTRQVHVDVGGGPLDELIDDLPPLPIREVPSTPRIKFDFTFPLGDLAIDTDGSLYIADALLSVVYRIGPCDDLEIVAGNGAASVRGDEGDGGPATGASIHPTALALDRDKHVLYIVDTPGYRQSRVRAVNRGRADARVLGRDIGPGRIDTVVGAGSCGDGVCSAGDGSPAREAIVSHASIELRPDGGLVLAEQLSHRVRLVDPHDAKIYGVLGPWPEAGGQTTKQVGDMPPGYLGDGGPALAAWTSGVQTFVGGTPYGRIATAMTPDDDLLVADGLGRVRRVEALTNAPRRTGRPVLGVPNAGRGFSDTIVLDDGEAAGTGPARPVVVAAGAETYVLAARGAGNGCFLWSVTTDANGRGRDAATPRGAVGPRSGVGIGGRRCGLAPTDDGLAALTTVRPRDAGPLARDLALYAATTADDGGSWHGVPAGLPERVDATGDDEVVVAATESGVSAAYTGAGGELHVADSADGTSYTVTGTFAPDHVRLGDYVVDGSRQLLGLVTRKTGLLDVSHALEVAHSTDGRTWAVSKVAPVTAPEITSRPAVAVAPSGRVYVAWSDGTDVKLAWSGDMRTWSAPVRIPGGSANANPSLAVDAKGTVVVGYVGAPIPRAGNVRNPYTQWYAYAAVGTPEKGFTAHLASDAPVHYGALCYDSSCKGAYTSPVPALDETRETFRELGRVRVLLRPNGDLHLVVAMTPNTGNNRSTTRAAIGHLRACRDLGVHGTGRKSRCALATGGNSVRQPLPVPVPAAPPVPGISPCSPKPPAFARPASPSPPADVEEDPEIPRGSAVVVPFLPLIPPPPVFPAANAPVNAAQNARALEQSSQQQTSSQGQYGAAENEDEQPELALLGAAAVLSAAAAAYKTQQSTSPNRSDA